MRRKSLHDVSYLPYILSSYHVAKYLVFALFEGFCKPHAYVRKLTRFADRTDFWILLKNIIKRYGSQICWICSY